VSCPRFVHSVFRLALFFIPYYFIATPSFSQNLAFEQLLESLYDESFPIVMPSQIAELSNYQVLDTREKSEFEVSHLPGAQWVGYDTFKLSSLSKLEKEMPILVYCTVGVRSEDIGKKLREAGFTRVYNLYGGIINWANAGKELEAKGQATERVHTYSMAWGIWLEQGEKVY
jgi:rhodanese-related sulfurtransferase